MNSIFNLKNFSPKLFLAMKRSSLTLFSTAFGVFTLLMLLAMTQALTALSQQDLLNHGAAGAMWIQAGHLAQSVNGLGMNIDLELNEKDFQQMKNLTGVDYASPVYFQNLTVKSAFHQLNNASVFGVGRDFFNIKRYPLLADGRYFHRLDQTKKHIIIDKNLALTLFNQINPLGKMLIIAGHAFIIIGVVDTSANNQEEANLSIWLPENSFKILFSPYKMQGILLKSRLTSGRDLLKRQLLTSFALSHQLPLHEPSLLQIDDSFQHLQQQEHFNWVLKTIFFLVGSAMLLLSCLGLTGFISSLLIDDSVEIGLKLALGARYKLIQMDYLLFATAISLIAVLIAAAAAYLFAELFNALHIYLWAFQNYLQLKINIGLIVLSGGTCLFMSICAVFWPLRHLKHFSPVSLLKQI